MMSSLLDNCDSVDVEDLIMELEVMKKLTPHPNILNLLGYCTGKILPQEVVRTCN